MGELSATMGSSEFESWHKFYRIEPWGAWRDNMHAGLIASTLVKLLGKQRRKAPEAVDFVLKPAKERKKTETLRGLSWFRAIARPKT